MISLILLALLVVVVTAKIPEIAGLPTGFQICLERCMTSSFAPSQASVLDVAHG
jgi:hypothetical protein